MLNIKDKELRKALFDAKIIYDPWKDSVLGDSNSIRAESVVHRWKECFELLNAMADYLGIEAHTKEQSNAKYFFVKKNSAEARKLKAKRKAEAVHHSESWIHQQESSLRSVR